MRCKMSNLRRWLPALAVLAIAAGVALLLHLVLPAAPAGYYISERALKVELPPVEEALSDRVEIVRQFSSPEEERLLRIAEAVYPDAKEVARRLQEDWLWAGASVPEGPDIWWIDDGGTVYVYAVTVDAVQYYVDLATRVPDSRCSYVAEITQLPGGKVYVAELSLFWSTMKPVTPDRPLVTFGREFSAKRTVWLAADGRVLAVRSDGPVSVITD